MDKENKIQIPVIFEQFTSRVDGSYKLVLSTNVELKGSEVGVLAELLQKHLHLLMKETEATDEDLKAFDEVTEEDKEFFNDKAKTKSQRLRNVLYVYWEHLGSKGDFREFYEQKMESLIEIIKQKLD